MPESQIKIIAWCVLIIALFSLFIPIFYITVKEIGFKQGVAIIFVYLLILSVMIVPGLLYGKGPLSISSYKQK